MDEKQYVEFTLGKEHYGISIMEVEEIILMIDVTPVPRAPSFIEGIINLRGKVIPVIDLRKRLNLSKENMRKDRQIIVIIFDGKRLGFIVDNVLEVLRIPKNIIDHNPGSKNSSKHYIEGIARLEKKMLIILDMYKIFTPDEHAQLVDLK